MKKQIKTLAFLIEGLQINVTTVSIIYIIIQSIGKSIG